MMGLGEASVRVACGEPLTTLIGRPQSHPEGRGLSSVHPRPVGWAVYGVHVTSNSPFPDPWARETPSWGTSAVPPPKPEPDPSTLDGLIELLDLQFRWLVKVSRHEISYKDAGVEETYRTRSRVIRDALKRYGVEDPFPWRTAEDFWDKFCVKWATYRERKQSLLAEYEAAEKALDALRDNPHKLQAVALSPDAAWASLEGRITGLMKEYETADALDDFQDVGRRSREILIAAVNLVYEPSMCPTGEEPPQKANAKRRFELVLAAEVSGRSNKDLRDWFKATWDLAQSTTHSGSAARAAAFASGQSALTLARMLHILFRDSAPHPTNPNPSDDGRPS
jgi:hypothetical protein